MPNWSNRPPDGCLNQGLPLVRTPARGVLSGIVSSTDLVGCTTHYYKGRTQPCTAPNCEACNEQVPYRWHAYLTIFNPRTATHALLELTAQASQPAFDFFERHGTLRGAILETTRPSAKPNGRIIVRLRQATPDDPKPPKEPNIKKILAVIWNLPANAVNQSGTLEGAAHIHVDRDTVDAAQRHPAELPAAKRNGRAKRDITPDERTAAARADVLATLDQIGRTDGPR